MIHALDGLGTGLVIVPVLGNFMVKVYKTQEKGAATSYGSIVKAMLEIVTFMVNLQKNTIVKVSIKFDDRCNIGRISDGWIEVNN